MGLSFAEKSYLFTKKIDFPKIRYKNVRYFNLGHALFFLPAPIFFLAPFLSYFSALSLLLPLAFHIFSGCCKTLGVIYGQRLEIGP